MAINRTTVTRVGALLVSALLPALAAAEVVDRRTTVAAGGEVTQLSEAGRLTLLENVRALGLREVVIEPALVAEGAAALTAADVDADGDADLFAAGDAHFSLALQAPGGQWERVARPNPGSVPVSGVSAVDVDGDGSDELVVSREDRPLLVAYRGGRWVVTRLPRLAGPATQPSAADFNGDGLVDLFFPVVGVDALLLQEAGRWVVAAHWVVQDREAGRWSACLDADQDQRTDLFVANDGQDRVFLQRTSP